MKSINHNKPKENDKDKEEFNDGNKCEFPNTGCNSKRIKISIVGIEGR